MSDWERVKRYFGEFGQQVADFVKNPPDWTIIFSPVKALFGTVIGDHSVGLFVVAALFFMIWLVKAGAGSRSTAAYGHAMRTMGGWGMVGAVLYVVALGLERTLVPVLAMLLVLTLNTLIGASTNFSAILSGLADAEARAQFLTAVVRQSAYNPSMFPLSIRAATILFLTFLCMWLVGRLFQVERRHVGD